LAIVNRIWLGFILLFSFGVLTLRNADAQDTDKAQAAQQSATQKAIDNDLQKSRNDMEAFLRSRISTSTIQSGAGTTYRGRLSELQLAIPKFRDATSKYREMLGLNGKLDKPLQMMRAQINAMLRSLKSTKMNPPSPDALEFKDYSKAELKWEALNSAEHLAAVLDVVGASQNQDVISIKTQQLLYEFQGDLLRLKWLTIHVE